MPHNLLQKIEFGAFWCATGGRSLLMLLPSEKVAMLRQLENDKIPVQTLKINPNKTQPIGPALQAMLSKSTDLKVQTSNLLLSVSLILPHGLQIQQIRACTPVLSAVPSRTPY